MPISTDIKAVTRSRIERETIMPINHAAPQSLQDAPGRIRDGGGATLYLPEKP